MSGLARVEIAAIQHSGVESTRQSLEQIQMKLNNSAFRLHDSESVFMASGNALECFLKFTGCAVVFFHPPWKVGWRYAIRLRLLVRQLKARDIDVVLCCNERSEARVTRIVGIPSWEMNQNMHVPEKVYFPLDGCENLYDAIYFAQAKAFKRIHLASQVQRLFVLTYACKQRRGEHGEFYDLHGFEPRVKHCQFNRSFIEDPDELRRLLSSSTCGLCLSSKEGAMWASMEYLMSGLPIVTTRSTGGRDHYFDGDYTTWVAANPRAVAIAVEHYKNHPLDPAFVRTRVLAKVRTERERFLMDVNRYLAAKRLPSCDAEYIWGGEQGIYSRHQPIVPNA
jgi:glycosyltransferase involved in cell wall biosynthesis